MRGSVVCVLLSPLKEGRWQVWLLNTHLAFRDGVSVCLYLPLHTGTAAPDSSGETVKTGKSIVSTTSVDACETQAGTQFDFPCSKRTGSMSLAGRLFATAFTVEQFMNTKLNPTNKVR